MNYTSLSESSGASGALSAQAQTNNKGLWTGRILSGLLVAFLVLDGIMKLAMPAPVAEASARMGLSHNTTFAIGVVLLASTALYAIQRTSVLGAILLTGYLGGATAANVLAGTGAFGIFFSVGFGVLVWVGLFVRDARLRALIPFRS